MTGAARRIRPHSLEAEASILGGIMLRNEVLARLENLEVEDFYDLRHKNVFAAVRTLEAQSKPIDVVTLEAELDRTGKLESLGGAAFLAELQLRVPTPDNVVAYAEIVTKHSRVRKVIIVASEIVERGYGDDLDAEEFFDDARARIERAGAAQRSPRWQSARAFVDVIEARRGEPWVSLRLGGDDLVSVRPGGIVLLVGGTGRGKSSLAATLLVEHARDHGPAVAMSLELPGDEWVARAIGTRRDASWSSVLRGELSREHMLDALPERLAVVDREHASLRTLGEAVDSLKSSHPGAPVLVAVDYVQLVELAGDHEIRVRIGRVMRELDRLARARRVVLIALSQGSRASSRALASGERIGAEAVDTGAESADLERWASVVVTIGQPGSVAEDGTKPVDLSIGKARMAADDKVIPARFNGRTGLWRLAGEARPAADVRAERTADKNAAKLNQAELAIAQLVIRADAPRTREDLEGELKGVGATIARMAIANLIARGELVQVAQRKPHAKAWKLWTRERANANGIAIIGDREADR